MRQLADDAVEKHHLYHGSMEQTDTAYTMSPVQLVEYLETLSSDPSFSSLLTAEQKDGISKAKTQLDDGTAQLKGDEQSRLTITTRLPVESEKTSAFVKELSALCDEELSGEHYLIGNSIMVGEMESGFGREQLVITLLTALRRIE